MKQAGHKEEGVKELQDDVTGHYILKHPLLVIFKPKLRLYHKENSRKVEGEIGWMGFKKRLKLDTHIEHNWVFQFHVDIITIDVVINFITIETFEGFLDTPVGHFKFTGKRVGSS